MKFFRRHKWYEFLGQNGVWSADQNEECGPFGFKLLAVMEVKSRSVVHFEVLICMYVLHVFCE